MRKRERAGKKEQGTESKQLLSETEEGERVSDAHECRELLENKEHTRKGKSKKNKRGLKGRKGRWEVRREEGAGATN